METNAKIEVAYRVVGDAWKRKTMTEQAFDRWLDRMTEKHGVGAIEVQTRPAE